MTGRRLYDHFADALVDATYPWQRTKPTVGQIPTNLPAWPMLNSSEQRVWNNLARRVTPKRKAA